MKRFIFPQDSCSMSSRGVIGLVSRSSWEFAQFWLSADLFNSCFYKLSFFKSRWISASFFLRFFSIFYLYLIVRISCSMLKKYYPSLLILQSIAYFSGWSSSSDTLWREFKELVCWIEFNVIVFILVPLFVKYLGYSSAYQGIYRINIFLGWNYPVPVKFKQEIFSAKSCSK